MQIDWGRLLLFDSPSGTLGAPGMDRPNNAREAVSGSGLSGVVWQTGAAAWREGWVGGTGSSTKRFPKGE